MITENYSQEAIEVVEDIIEMFDVVSLVKYAMNYVGVHHWEVMDYVLDNIEDSTEFTQEEWQYLAERVRWMMDRFM